MEDAFLKQIVFDDDIRCFEVTEVDGMEVFIDITQGMRMAQKSGLTELDGLDALFANGGKCESGMAVGGDKVILAGRDGPGGKAVYWCRACYSEDFEAREKRPPTNTNFKRLSATASGRPFMTANGIAKSALYKLARDTFGDGSRRAWARCARSSLQASTPPR